MIYSWLLIITLAYFFLSLSSLGNKLVLAGTSKPTSFTFYVGMLNISVLIFLPFIAWSFPNASILWWMIAEAIVFMLGLYTMYWAIEYYDVTKVITTIGATQPIFILILTWLIWGEATLGRNGILAFILLVIGNIIISLGKNAKATEGYLKLTLLAALFFAVDYILSKIIFLSVPFLYGLFWMRMFAFFLAFILLVSKKNRKEIFEKKTVLNKKTELTFMLANTAGGASNILQSFAISLAPVAFLPVVNSLNGLQYVFLFFLTLFVSYFWPKALHEKETKKIIIQKIISIIFIASGLALLVL
jgi:drug/metabolite transporter (DMT)-like permease